MLRVREFVSSPDGGIGEISGVDTMDPGSKSGGWISELDSAPLNIRYTTLHSATTVQNMTIFLIRRRRFLASICCLYRSGRYIEPVSFGFLFTTAASDDYLLLYSLPVKKERGLKKMSGIRNECFFAARQSVYRKNRSEKGCVILLANYLSTLFQPVLVCPVSRKQYMCHLWLEHTANAHRSQEYSRSSLFQ